MPLARMALITTSQNVDVALRSECLLRRLRVWGAVSAARREDLSDGEEAINALYSENAHVPALYKRRDLTREAEKGEALSPAEHRRH